MQMRAIAFIQPAFAETDSSRVIFYDVFSHDFFNLLLVSHQGKVMTAKVKSEIQSFNFIGIFSV
jgi:hypothetical protein